MRLTLLLSLLVAVLNLNGQAENKGKFYLSGNTSLTYANNFRGSFEQGNFESSHLGYFLTNRLMIGAEVLASTEDDLYDGSPFVIGPFVRYYLPFNRGGKTQYFAEGGLGIFGNFGFGSSYETDLYLGVGAERDFGDGIVGTTRLRYKANASGINLMELDLGLNFILGGPQSWEGFSARQMGAFLIDPELGSIGFGRRSRGNVRDFRVDLNLGVGYYMTRNLLVEVGYNVDATAFSIDSQNLQEIDAREWRAFIGLRYFLPATTGRLQPFVLARAVRTGSTLNLEGSFPSIESSKSSESFAEVGAGTLYYLTNNAALDFSVRYETGINFPAGRDRNLVSSVGLKVFLGKN